MRAHPDREVARGPEAKLLVRAYYGSVVRIGTLGVGLVLAAAACGPSVGAGDSTGVAGSSSDATGPADAPGGGAEVGSGPAPEQCDDDEDCPAGGWCVEPGVCVVEVMLPECDAAPALKQGGSTSRDVHASAPAPLWHSGAERPNRTFATSGPSGGIVRVQSNGLILGPDAALPSAAQQGLQLATGDLNADGSDDVAIAFAGAGVTVALGGGNGRIFPFSEPWSGAWPHDATDIAIASVTGDAWADVVTLHPGAIEVWPGAGDGTLLPALPFEIVATGLAVGDLLPVAGDEIVLAEDSQTRIAVVLESELVDRALLHGSGFAGPSAVAVADVDGDGHADLVRAGPGATGLRTAVWPTQGGDTLTSPRLFALDGVDAGPTSTGDLDLDGSDDILITDEDSGFVVAFGDPQGLRCFARYDLVDPPQGRVAVGDFNGDSKPDVCLMDASGATLLKAQ